MAHMPCGEARQGSEKNQESGLLPDTLGLPPSPPEVAGAETAIPSHPESGESLTMPEQPHKMSEIMKEMAEMLLRHTSEVASSEAAHVALFLANVAWNESVGLGGSREGCRHVWGPFEAENPALWDEFKSSDIDAMIDELVRYKKDHYPDDRRRILTCGIPDGKLRVEWLNPAAPGVDAGWEMRLYGLVRTGERQAAIRFLQETRGLTRAEAAKRVAAIAVELRLL